ncbi:MAG: ABC transporter substrate-binding protein [Bdellovibrionales bacterium]
MTKFSLILICFFISFPALALEKVKLGLNWKAEPEFAGFYAAQINKHYEKAGLDVELIEGAANAPIVQMVATGQLDFGIATGDQVIVARERGADIVALFSVYQKSPACLMVREDSGIKSIKDLMASDFTIAVGGSHPYASYLQKKYPGSKAKIVPYMGGITNFLNDKKFAQQCFVGSEPELAIAKGVKTRTLPLADEGLDNYAALVVTNGKFLKEKSELAKKLVAASHQGWLDYYKNPKPAHDVIGKLNSAMDPKTMDAIMREQKPYVTGKDGNLKNIGKIEKARWDRLQKQLKDLDMVKKTTPADSFFKIL